MRRFKGWLRIGAGARFGSGCLDRWDGANIDLTLGVPRVVRGLHPDPDAGAVAEQLAEAHGDGGGHGLSLIEDVVEVLARDAEQTCDLRLRPCDRRDNLFAQQLARMTRAAVRVATCGNLGHDLALQWYCSKPTRTASPSSNSNVRHQGPLTWTL